MVWSTCCKLTFVSAWLSLPAKMKVILACVDENPPVRSLWSTPISESKESLAAMPEVTTPDVTGVRAPEDEPAGRLVDRRNEYQAVSANRILASRNGTLELRESLACAYLVRGGGEALLSVEIVRADRGYDFKEALESIHGLCVLSRARSVDGELPWHLAVVKKAAAALEDF